MQTIFSLLLLVAAACAFDYCKISKEHTMCKYRGPVGPALFSGVTKEEDKRVIVDAHNKYRRKVALGEETIGPQPPAANMKKVKWDDELATIAQMWTDQWVYDHDPCRDVPRFQVGQNIFVSGSKGIENYDQEWGLVVDKWYSEVSMVQPQLLKSYVDGEWGHYTQVVWDETEYIGCGFTSYKREDGWLYKLYVCNYGPSGNYPGRVVYEVGAPCSKCTNGCDNGLCL